MAKTIKLTPDQWSVIRKRLKEEYQWKPSVLAIQSVCRRELGFTVRSHTGWLPDNGPAGNYDGYGQWLDEIHLDFWDDEKETFFRLKYL